MIALTTDETSELVDACFLTEHITPAMALLMGDPFATVVKRTPDTICGRGYPRWNIADHFTLSPPRTWNGRYWE